MAYHGGQKETAMAHNDTPSSQKRPYGSLQQQAKEAGVDKSTVWRREKKRQQQQLPAPPPLKRSINESGPGSLYKHLVDREAWLEDAGEDHPDRERIVDACHRLRDLMARKINPKWLTFPVPPRDLAAAKWWRK
jgi:hypothetical protein